jgi:hypothetical protein
MVTLPVVTAVEHDLSSQKDKVTTVDVSGVVE